MLSAAARFVRLLGYLGFLAFAAPLLLFAALELSPRLRQLPALDGIRYYGLQRRYVADPALVFVPAPAALAQTAESRGDLDPSRFGIEAPAVRFRMSWNEWGFRSNGGGPPWGALVIGDSYIEIGETDDDTLSERLRRTSGASTFNLGRGWYGPHQYVELLRRFAPATQPRYALLCFFAGNDVENIAEYERWARGGSYYDWGSAQRSFPVRYWIALTDTHRFLEERLSRWWRRLRAGPVQNLPATAAPFAAHAAPRPTRGPAHPRVGLVVLGGEVVAMRFAYRPEPRSPEELLASQEWRTLRELLAEFRAVADGRGIVPILVNIPTKFEVYGALVTPESGAEVLAAAAELRPFLDASAAALGATAASAGIELIDLLPGFRRRAAQGELLYSPFDSHWNPAGRQAAAEEIARALAAREP